MYEKITFPVLVNLLADKTGKSKKVCEDFLREFFSTVADTLSAGENVKIKSIGTFKIVEVEARKSVNVNTGEDIEIPGHRKIAFIPSKELAEEVNSPFSMFETVEISDNALVGDESDDENTEEQVSDAETVSETECAPIIDNVSFLEEKQEIPENTQEVIIENKESEIPITEIAEEEPEESYPASEPISAQEVQPESISEPIQATDIDSEAGETFLEEEPQPRKKRWNFLWGFLCGLFCTAIVIAVCYIFLADKFNAMLGSFQDKDPALVTPKVVKAEPVPAITVQVKDSDSVIAETPEPEQDNIAPTAPSDEKVYDTISNTRYLTTMAKAHYGNYNLWPYIYEENKAILGHPDRIRPGTKVVIPSLSKYGVDPNNPEHIRIAKQKGVEIYARFK